MGRETQDREDEGTLLASQPNLVTSRVVLVPAGTPLVSITWLRSIKNAHFGSQSDTSHLLLLLNLKINTLKFVHQ